MRFPSMTTRRWMVLVAVVSAIGAAWNTIDRRREHLESIAVAHLGQVRHLAYRKETLSADRVRHALGLPIRTSPWTYGVIVVYPEERQSRLDVWHMHLYDKYHEASLRSWPWTTVEPDPPEPE